MPPARPIPSLLDDVRAGLLTPPRSLPPKYFYDETGARLFEAICETAEYYPTRTEDALLQAIAGELIALARPRHLLELGSGSSRKTRRLIEACAGLVPAPVYWPFDVSREMLLHSARALNADYPWLGVHALVGDYHGGLDHLPVPEGPVLWLFLGGTIGNFSPSEAQAFLSELRRRMGAQDLLLLAVDRVKDRARLEAAYDDAGGVTAAFNRTVLAVLSRALGSDFDPAAFAHRAPYDEDRQQIEMYLDPLAPQRVRLPALDTELQLLPGDAIRTEISRKFTRDSLRQMVAGAGLVLRRQWDAPGEDYSLVLVGPAADAGSRGRP